MHLASFEEAVNHNCLFLQQLKFQIQEMLLIVLNKEFQLLFVQANMFHFHFSFTGK